MAEYTKVFENPYPDGWENAPSENTPITASALQEHTDAIENIEDYLYDNPIGGGSAQVEYGTSAEFEVYKQDTSVPVGTEYIVTDDYTQSGNDFSFSEKIIGTFMGKTLYSKIYQYNQALGTSTKTTTIPKANIGYIKDIVWVRSGTRRGLAHPNVWSLTTNDYLQIDHHATMSLNTDEQAYLVIEYTKVGD